MDATVVQPLLQRALNLMETASCWQRKAAKRAHIVGLQGEKRCLRYLSRKARNIADWIEHRAYDHLRLDICSQPGSIDISSLMCIMSTMNGIIAKLWIVRNEAHQIANDLVIAKYRKYAHRLYKYVECLDHILTRLQRAQTEYERAEYEYQFIARHQLAWENVHDIYEKKEKKQGYKS